MIDEQQNALRGLVFRPERSRPVWRNKHTGAEYAVVDLAVNDHGGFQGGCRQHVVITDEPGPPPRPVPDARHERGPRGANVHSLWSWLEHWEPTGDHVDWTDDVPERPEAGWRRRALAAEDELRKLKAAVAVIRDAA